MLIITYHSLQPVLISRFFLNLRQSDSSPLQSELYTTHGTVNFIDATFRVPTAMDSIMGNMGAPVHDGLFEDDEGDDENIHLSGHSEDGNPMFLASSPGEETIELRSDSRAVQSSFVGV